MKERIKILRKHLGLTMEQFGEHLGVTKSAISNIENGNRRVTEQMLKSVCREFGVNENWMRNGVGNMFVEYKPDYLCDQSISFNKLNSFSQRIKEVRQYLDLTQQEFADILHTSRNNIAGYETGSRVPSAAVISLICREFGINENWLRNGIEKNMASISIENQQLYSDNQLSLAPDSSLMNERIKRLRIYFKLSRTAFGERIGVSCDVINNLERGRVEVKEYMIKLICTEFGINENWLRNGVGNAFINKQSDLINGLSQFYDLDDLSKSMLEEYLKLSADHKDVIKNYILSIADNLSSKK